MKTFKIFYEESNSSSVETVAILPGGFKPPTKGHYNALQYLLRDADRGIVFIGNKDRDGITAEQSKKIWEVYSNNINKPIEVLISQVTPVKSVYDFADNNKNINIIVGAGDKDEDIKRYSYFEKNSDKYPLVKIGKIPLQSEGISGTKTRSLINSNLQDAINYFVPNEVNSIGREAIKNILSV